MFGIFITSCNKKENVQTSGKASQKEIKSFAKGTDIDDAENLDNPYDIIGYLHNHALQDTRNIWLNQSEPVVYSTIKNYIDSIGYDTTGIPNLSLFQNNPLDIQSDSPYLFTNFLSLRSNSIKIHNYEVTLYGLVMDAGSTASYSDFKATIVSLEASVLADNSLTQSERQTILETASVVRYSMIYWMNEDNGYNDGNTNPCESKIWNWIKNNWKPILKVVLSDAAGALATPPLLGAVLGSGIALLP